MAKYKVPFSGFVVVEADDEDGALYWAMDGETIIYEQSEWDGYAKVLKDFNVERGE